MTDTDKRMAALSPQKRKLLAMLKQQKARKQGEQSGCSPFELIADADKARLPQGLEDAYPLGMVQLGMMFHMNERLDANAPPDYHNVASYWLRFNHTFRPECFQQAVDKVVAAEDILRTAFNVSDFSEPLQLVYREARLPVIYEDIRTLPEADKDPHVKAFIERENFNLFDMTKAPLQRYHVHHLEDSLVVFSITEPHAISDGWSTHLTLLDLLKSYFALVEGSTYELPHAPTRYADFIKAEREVMQSAKAKAFWQQQLSEVVVTELPLKSPSDDAADFGDHRKWLEVPRAVSDGIKRLVGLSGAPIKSVLLAAHCRLLSILTGQQTITTGLNFNGRLEVKGGTEVRGLFLNMLPLTVALPGGSWLELVRQVHQAETDILPYRRYPLGTLQREYGKKNLFDTAFHYLHFHSIANGGVMSDGRFECLECIDHSKTNYDYNPVFMTDPLDPDKLSYVHDANLSRFTVAQLDSFCQYYQHILADMAANPEANYNRLDFLGDAQRQHLLVDCNRTHRPFDLETPFYRLFERQAAQNPTAVALVCDQSGASLSYGQANAKANRFARALQARGIGSGSNVVVYLPRSVETVVALLAIAKTGATYVPLDINTPPERVAGIVEDCNAAQVLGVGEAGLDSPISWLDAHQAMEAADKDRLDTCDLDLDIDPQQAAYILFTSGSTGKPKGVMVPHSALSNYLLWARTEYRCQARDCMPLYTSLSFDLTVTSLFVPLISGACVRVFEAPDVATLLGRIVQSRTLTLIKLTPAHLALLVAMDLSHWQVDRLIVGGEQLRHKLAMDITEQLPQASVFNEYGPTEATVGCMLKRFDPSLPPTPSQAVSIGKPAANTAIYLLDELGHPVPEGVKGQIYIAGAGLALGYLGDPAQSAERFVDCPFAPGKMYRTGDLARRLGDDIEFLGRIDGQTKLNGYRIELAEIEQKVEAVDGIARAVVVIRQISQDHQLVCYVEPEQSQVAHDEAATQQYIKRLRGRLGEALPSYMVPGNFLFVEKFDLTVNGKVDRDRLPEPEQYQVQHSEYQAPSDEVEKALCEIWQKLLDKPQVGVNDNFFDIGGSSVLSFQLQVMVSENTDYPLSVTDIFEYPTVAELAQFIRAQTEELPEAQGAQASGHEAIALIGMAGRFADAATLERFWHNLAGGHESLHWYDNQTLLDAGLDKTLVENPHYVAAGAMLDNLKAFDADYFDVTPRAAQMMDPQQRLLLECAVEALDDGGYGNSAEARSVGLFAGVGEGLYFLNNLAPNRDWIAGREMEVLFANSRDFAATRVSHKLNLTGPSVTVSSACSTSLVAIHQACASLLANECDMALAGGAKVGQFRPEGYLWVEGGILSKDGHCRAFDAQGSGTRGGDGAALVLLKRLSRAQDDGDNIYALIKGSAVNNDGNAKAGFTAPGVAGQAAVIEKAMQNAGVGAEDISYVETHGTGTVLGDPIEIRGLNRAFKRQSANGRVAPASVAIGSVKTNIGHLDAAAGVTGVIKTVLAMRHKQLPPSLNFEQANPVVDFAGGPFYVNSRLSDWPKADKPMLAGVSSFGIGGTNAHVIVEQAPGSAIKPNTTAEGKPHLIVVSARSNTALQQVKQRLATHLQQHPQLPLNDVAYTLEVGRTCHAYRDALVIDDTEQLVAQWQQAPVSETQAAAAKVCNLFMFSGQGSQYQHVAKDLYRQSREFAAAFDRCAELFDAALAVDVTRWVVGQADETPGDINDTLHAQPLIFSVSYALFAMMQAQGIEPEGMIGHSIGEYVAAVVAEVMTLEQAVNIIAVRAGLMQSAEPGNMVAVAADGTTLEPMMRQTGAEIAAVNGPKACVLSIAAGALDTLKERLSNADIEYRVLHTSHGYHSAMMDPILGAFAKALNAEMARQPFACPKQRYVGNLHGDYVDGNEVTKADYWVSHLRHTVQFGAGLARLLKDNAQHRIVLWELGPGNGLSMLARKQDGARDALVLPTVRHVNEPVDDGRFYLSALARYWRAGGTVRVATADESRRVSLPSYPFERQTYWIEPPHSDASESISAPQAAGQEGSLADSAEQCFYQYRWSLRSTARLAKRDDQADERVLIVADTLGLAQSLQAALSARGTPVMTVTDGAGFEALDGGHFRLDLACAEDIRMLVQSLDEQQRLPDVVIHCGGVGTGSDEVAESFDSLQRSGLQSARLLVKSLLECRSLARLKLVLVNNDTLRVTGDETLRPGAATLQGLAKVAPQEYQQISSCYIDLSLGASGAVAADYAQAIVEELSLQAPPVTVALRGPRRWVGDVALIEGAERVQNDVIRKNGVYLLTGGLGNIGLTLAGALARDHQAKVVLVGRTPLPPQSQWPQSLSAAEPGDPLAAKLEKLLQIARDAAGLKVFAGDCADPVFIDGLMDEVSRQWGEIHGVIHCAGKVGNFNTGLSLLDKDDFEQQYQAKVHGLMVLDQALERLDRTPDFVLVMSSLASCLGGLGFTAYAAANNFADAFVNRQHALGQEHWLSVGWDGWDFSADASDTHHSVTPEQGVKAFYYALSIIGIPQLLHSSVAMAPRIDKWLKLKPKSNPGTLFARPQLSSEYRAAQSDTERALVAIWQQLLGIELIGVDDNFFELGGDSLLVARALTLLRHRFEVAEQDISLHLFFEQPTIAQLAEHIDNPVDIAEQTRQALEAAGMDIEEGEF